MPLVLLSVLLAIIAMAAGAEGWESPGDGVDYTLDDLVSVSGGAVTGSDGEFWVHEEVTVSEEDSLTVLPGTTVLMGNGTVLRIFGTVELLGTVDEPILLTSSNPREHSWQGLYTQDTPDESKFRNTTIRHAREALNIDHHIDISNPDWMWLDNLTIRDCPVGINASGVARMRITGLRMSNTTDWGVWLRYIMHTVMYDCWIGGNVSGLDFVHPAWDDASVALRNITMEDGDLVTLTVPELTIEDVRLKGGEARFNNRFHVTRASITNLSCGGEVWFNGTHGNVTGLSCGGELGFRYCHMNVTDITFFEPTYVYVGGGHVSLDRFELKDSPLYSVLGNRQAVVRLSNATLTGSDQFDLRLSREVAFHLYNVTFEDWFLGYDWHAEILLDHGVNVLVVDPYGAPIEGADVRVYNGTQELNRTLTTGPDGWARTPPIRCFEAIQGDSYNDISIFEARGPWFVSASFAGLANGSTVEANRTHFLTYVIHDDVPPVLNVTVPRYVDTDERFVLSALASTDNDPSFHETGAVVWTLGRGTADELVLTGFRVKAVLHRAGDHHLDVIVSDRSGNTVTAHYVITAVDVTPPQVSAPNVTTSLGQVSTVTLVTSDNSDGYPGDGTFTWTLDVEGEVIGAEGLSAEHLFTQPGNYSCQVHAEDAAGNGATATFWIRVVDDEPPVARAGPDVEVHLGEAVLLADNGSSDNHGIASYGWRLPFDPVRVLEGPEAEFSFEELGDHRVVLVVTDLSGNEGRDSLWVNVTPRRPRLWVTHPVNGTLVDANLTVNGTTEADLPSITLFYTLLLPSGNVTAGELGRLEGPFSFPLLFSGMEPGNCTLRVWAHDGRSASATVSVTFQVLPPDDGGGNGGNGGGGTVDDDEEDWWLRASPVQWLLLALIVAGSILAAVYIVRRQGRR